MATMASRYLMYWQQLVTLKAGRSIVSEYLVLYSSLESMIIYGAVTAASILVPNPMDDYIIGLSQS